MHIAMVTPLFPKEYDRIDGGVAGVVYYLSEELIKNPQLKLSIVVPQGSKGAATVEKWPNLTVYKMRKSRLARFLTGTMYNILLGKRKLNQFLYKLMPDLVHYQGTTHLAGNCKLPHVLTIHGIVEYDALWSAGPILNWFKYLLLRITENIGRKTVKNIIVISPYVQAVLKNKIAHARKWFIENPVAERYFGVRWDFEQGRIFACGKVAPHKNTLGMIEAFNLILRDFPFAQLRIAGTVTNKAYLTKCKNYVKKNRLDDKVHFLGSLSINQVQFELSKANCLLMPSFQENAPLSIEEAMAVGVPVVGANVGGIPYMVEDGKTGFLVNQFGNASIAEGICKILGDSELAHTMSVRAKQIASERFRASGVAQKTLTVYREILADAAIFI